MKPVWFTQFRRPHGVREQVSIDRDDEIAKLADELTGHGARLEIEVLSGAFSDRVSMEVVKDDGDGETQSIAGDIVKNGPGLPEAVDKMIKTAHERMTSDGT